MKLPVIRIRPTDANALRGANLRGQNRINGRYSLINMGSGKVALGRETDAAINLAAPWEVSNEILRRKKPVIYDLASVFRPGITIEKYFPPSDAANWLAINLVASDLAPAVLEELSERDARTFAGPLEAFLGHRGSGPRGSVSVCVSSSGILTISALSRIQIN